MIDKRIGKRVKQCRERLGLSQEEFAEKTGLTANYISTVERGMSFPRCEKLIILLNGLEVSADAIFCDVLDHSTSYKASELSEKLGREIIVVDPAGADLVSAVLDSTENKKQIRRQMYEQTGSSNCGQA